MELGFYTFADVIPSPETEKTMSPAQRLRNLVEEIELADQVGLDVFGIGEHQRPEYAASAPVIVLDAASDRTHNIRLHFAPLVKIYRDAAQESGHDATILPVGITSHGYIADTSQQARDEHAPFYIALFNRFAPERGWSPMTRRNYDAATSLYGAVLVGSPEEVTEKILMQHKIFGHQRFLMQSSVGAMPHRNSMHAIELFGTKVAPVVRRETANEAPTPKKPIVDSHL